MRQFSCITVDDDPIILKILRDLISRDDRLHLINECPDSLSAASLITKMRPEIIFLDIMLPGLDGLEVLEILDVKPAVIVVSGLKDMQDKTSDYLEVVDCLSKPIDPDGLKVAVEKCIEFIQTQHEARLFSNAEKATKADVSTKIPNH